MITDNITASALALSFDTLQGKELLSGRTIEQSCTKHDTIQQATSCAQQIT